MAPIKLNSITALEGFVLEWTNKSLCLPRLSEMMELETNAICDFALLFHIQKSFTFRQSAQLNFYLRFVNKTLLS